MRKRRAIVYDDEAQIRDLLERFLAMKGYEVFSFSKPVVCPVFLNNDKHCHGEKPCADIMISDYMMPGMNGLELLRRQRERGCRLDMRNKAIISGFGNDQAIHEGVSRLGCAYFYKPFHLLTLSDWIDECERRVPLSLPVGIPRKEPRSCVNMQVVYSVPSYDGRLQGTITNVSSTGFCLQMDRHFPDDELTVIDADLPLSCQKATVRWTRQIDRTSYVAGLNCAKDLGALQAG